MKRIIEITEHLSPISIKNDLKFLKDFLDNRIRINFLECPEITGKIQQNTKRLKVDMHQEMLYYANKHPKRGKNIMKLFHQKAQLFSLTCLGMILFNSCAQTTSYEEEKRIIVSPHKLSAHSGSEDPVFVKVLDKQGGPLFGMKVTATSTSPTVATVTPEKITDPAGKAVFIVHGISPGTTKIIFSAAEQKAAMEVVFIGH